MKRPVFLLTLALPGQCGDVQDREKSLLVNSSSSWEFINIFGFLPVIPSHKIRCHNQLGLNPLRRHMTRFI